MARESVALLVLDCRAIVQCTLLSRLQPWKVLIGYLHLDTACDLHQARMVLELLDEAFHCARWRSPVSPSVGGCSVVDWC